MMDALGSRQAGSDNRVGTRRLRRDRLSNGAKSGKRVSGSPTSGLAPIYLGERRYSYHVSQAQPVGLGDWVVATAETDVEQQIYDLYLAAEAHLQSEEYALALNAFEELQLFILHEVHPTMPLDPGLVPASTDLLDLDLIDVFAEHSATVLRAMQPTTYAFPRSMVAAQSKLPDALQKRLEPVAERGLLVTSFHAGVQPALAAAADATVDARYDDALALYQDGLQTVPTGDALIRGTMLHDMALLADKAERHDRAAELGGESLELMEGSGDLGAQARVLDTMVGVFARAGHEDRARQAAVDAARLRAEHNLGPIVASPIALSRGGDGLRPLAAAHDPAADATASVAAPVLIAAEYVASADVSKAYVVQNTEQRVAIDLATGTTKPLLEMIATTSDLGLVMGFAASPVQMVAYSTHMYFFVLPMAIGDCLLAIGNLDEAEHSYRSTLPYPYINLDYEAVRLWTRLADVYLARGDSAYRAARDDVRGFRAARRHYTRIVRPDGTIDPDSPLYADDAFVDLRKRVEALLAAVQPESSGENPEIVMRVLDARAKLAQIDAGLNFFGFGPDYVPPLSFEYLQTTARYFAQNASSIEQRYVGFKSTAESEELQRDQLDQQVEVARQSVVLEQRGVDEAQAAVDVAEANLAYAQVQLEDAQQAREDYGFVGWEAAVAKQLEEVEAGGLTKEEMVQLSGSINQPSLSEQQEIGRLQRAIEAAKAAIDIANTQISDAQARLAIAEQRVAIASQQQAYAEENRDFLDMRELTAGLWYELAGQARALARRYLDMAIEVAFLMERAYDAETERGLQVVSYDYGDPGANDLLGADRLLADIDSFTADYVMTVQSKKLPVKRVISLAGAYPTAFQRLRSTGSCRFGTEFADFDRAHPGMYLCKVRNVELALVGVTGATAVGGSLRNVGVSRFRLADGSTVTRAYPSDVMPISQYAIRDDALLFRFDPNQLRAFELGGIDALWQLELPQGANGFELSDLLDVQLVVYYDGFFAPALEAAVKAALPDTGGSARLISLALELPDELFFLKNNGSAEIQFTGAMFSTVETSRRRTSVALRLSGEPTTISGLTLRLGSREHGSPLTVTTDAVGQVRDALAPLAGEPVIDDWTLGITAEDNPRLVRDGALDLSGLRDVLVSLQYEFRYR